MNLDLIFLIDGSDSITVSQFEKIKDWKGAIALTRKRMSIQQLLDSREFMIYLLDATS